MPDSVSTGTISTSVELDTTPLEAGIKAAQALVAGLAKSLTGLKALTVYQKEFEAKHIRSMRKSGDWTPAAIGEWKSRYEQQQEKRNLRQPDKAQIVATNSAAVAGQPPEQKQLLRLTQQLAQGKLAWADYYAAVERLAAAHAARMISIQDRAAAMDARMQASIAQTLGNSPEAKHTAAVASAQSDYRKRIAAIDALPISSAEATALKKTAGTERDSRIAQASGVFARALASTQAALQRFTGSLERSAAISDRQTGDYAGVRDTKIAQAKNKFDLQQGIIARLAQNMPGGSGNLQIQQAAALNQSVYQGAVASANQQFAKNTENAKIAVLRRQFIQLEAAYQNGDGSLKQYVKDLAALIAELNALPKSQARSIALLQVARTDQRANQELYTPPAWITSASSSLGSTFGDSISGMLKPHARRRYQEFVPKVNNGVLPTIGRDMGNSLRGAAISGVGKLAGSGFQSLVKGGLGMLTGHKGVGGFLASLFGKKGGKKPTGTATDPIYTAQAAVGKPNSINGALGNVPGLDPGKLFGSGNTGALNTNMLTTGNAGGAQGGMSQIMSLFKGGSATGAGGSVAMGGLGAAMPYVAASMAISQLFGGQKTSLGRLFNGGILGSIFPKLSLGKLFHFAKGGIVPGVGHHDSVPALLTPGERVIPVGQKGGDVHYHSFGDVHVHVNNANDPEKMGFDIRKALITATAGS